MLHDQYDIIIIGAGPAGLIAAIESCRSSKKILVLERMHKPALKLIISGKGRCNITNSAKLKDFISHFGRKGRFLKFAFSEYFNEDLLKDFEKLGVQFKLERGGRYFPQSDDAMEIVKALLGKVNSLNIPVSTHCEVTAITQSPDKTFTVTVKRKKLGTSKSSQSLRIKTDKVLLATGGKSYPGTGSNGSGFSLASLLGHTITPLLPSLVPIETKGDTAEKLQGLSLKNIKASVWCENKKMGEQFGEMLFTDFGVTGPIILTLSKGIVKLIKEKQKAAIVLDLKPALDHKKVDQRLLREIHEHGKQSFKSLLKKLLPKKLIPVFIKKCRIPEVKQLNQLNSDDRKQLKMLLKEFRLEVKGFRSFEQAIITSGGIKTNDINPQTMESKLVKGLYFAGEIIDIDADTGGYNLQAAFSTGWVAGRAMGASLG